MDIGIVKAPLDFGAGTRGCCYAPSFLLDSPLIHELELLGHKVSTFNCKVAYHDENNIDNTDKTKFLYPIVKTCTDLAVIVDSIYSNGGMPLVLGGDHSILLGSLAGMGVGAKRKGETLGVLYLDAHGDFNTTDTTPSGNIHGECLSASCGIGAKALVNLYKETHKIEAENVCIVGARDLDPGEKRLLSDAHVKVFTASDIEIRGISNIIDQALQYLGDRVDKIHLSFDVDSVDPIYAPGTGIHIPGGLTYREVVAIADIIKGNKKFASADIVEYNPIRDIDSKTKRVCLDFIYHLLGGGYYF